MLRVAIRGERWASMDRLLEANLVEHRVQAALDAPNAERFATITAPTVLLGGTTGPEFINRALLTELAQTIPDATAAILPGLGHLAPEQQPEPIAAALLAHPASASARDPDPLHSHDHRRAADPGGIHVGADSSGADRPPARNAAGEPRTLCDLRHA